MAVSYQHFMNLTAPFVLAGVIALGSWVNKIEERQYQQKTEYATKVELAATAGRMEQMLSQFVRTYERLRDEDRESFGDAIRRIENRQLETGRKINEIAMSTKGM